MSTKIFATITAVAVLSASLAGCGGGGGVVHDYQGLDGSRSWSPYLSTSARLCVATVRGLDPDTDFVTVFRVDNTCKEFFDGAAPDDGTSFQGTLVNEISATPARDGTFPARFFSTVAGRVAAEAATDRVLVDYHSDGDDDDSSSDAAMRRAARSLAAHASVVAVTFYGANPENWATLRSEFAPLGNRLHLIPPPELSLDAVHDTLAEAGR